MPLLQSPHADVTHAYGRNSRCVYSVKLFKEDLVVLTVLPEEGENVILALSREHLLQLVFHCYYHAFL